MDEAAVRGAADPLGAHDQQRGQKREHHHQAHQYALRQHQAHIRPDAELHDGQRQKADHHRAAAGEDGGGGFAQRLYHIFLVAAVVAAAFVEAMVEEHREIKPR